MCILITFHNAVHEPAAQRWEHRCVFSVEVRKKFKSEGKGHRQTITVRMKKRNLSRLVRTKGSNNDGGGGGGGVGGVNVTERGVR